MSVSIEDRTRRIIPRWRGFAATSALGELKQPYAGGALEESQAFIEKRKLWIRNPSITSAAELIGAALVEGHLAAGNDAERFLESRGSQVAPLVLQMARSLSAESAVDHLDSMAESIGHQSPAATIRTFKRRLRSDPRNPILLTELARVHAMLGQLDKAKSAMRQAVALVTGNRYVLRSAARLFVHLDDPEQALDMLRGREATAADPWLLSAEIAVSSVAGRPPKFARRGQIILAADLHSPFETAELASAIGTLEFENGRNKVARQMFRRSLREPTENSVAQAAWAERQFGALSAESDSLSTMASPEADAWSSFLKAEWRSSIDRCEHWFADEPFSSRPPMLASYVASVALQDHKRAEQLARQGLSANPDNGRLRNNLVVALASMDRVDDAEREFRLIKDGSSPDHDVVLVATNGLLTFRQGRATEGRTLYRDAIALADRTGRAQLRNLALMYLAREESRAGNFVEATIIIEGLRRYGDQLSSEMFAFLEFLGRDTPRVP